MPKRHCDKLWLIVKFSAQISRETQKLYENSFSHQELEDKPCACGINYSGLVETWENFEKNSTQYKFIIVTNSVLGGNKCRVQ